MEKLFFPTKEVVEQYEENARREALTLQNILNPNNVDPEDFFQTGSQPAGREAEQTKNSKNEKPKGASGKPKEKPKIST